MIKRLKGFKVQKYQLAQFIASFAIVIIYIGVSDRWSKWELWTILLGFIIISMITVNVIANIQSAEILQLKIKMFESWGWGKKKKRIRNDHR